MFKLNILSHECDYTIGLGWNWIYLPLIPLITIVCNSSKILTQLHSLLDSSFVDTWCSVMTDPIVRPCELCLAWHASLYCIVVDSWGIAELISILTGGVGLCFCHLVNECFTSISVSSMVWSLWVLDICHNTVKCIEINICGQHFLLRMVWNKEMAWYQGLLTLL